MTGLDTPRPTAQLVHQFEGSWCGVPTIVGHYLVQSVPEVNGFVMLDIRKEDRPVEVSRLSIPGYTPHWTGRDPKSRRLVVTSDRPGNRTYLLTLDERTGKLAIDEKFRDADGKPGFSFASRRWPHGWEGRGRPHGAVFSR